MDGQKGDLATNFLATWFGTSLSAIIFAAFLLIYISTSKLSQPTSVSYRLYQALPNSQLEVSAEIQKQDARAKIIEGFFKNYSSELAVYSSLFISVADKYQFDWRLLPAISMQESNGGKRIPAHSFNPFGYGIYGGKVIRFASFEEAIEKVGKALRTNYVDEGLTTPESIMAKYTPPSLLKGGVWAKGVSSFMEELR